LSAELTKTHSFRLLFGNFPHWVISHFEFCFCFDISLFFSFSFQEPRKIKHITKKIRVRPFTLTIPDTSSSWRQTVAKKKKNTTKKTMTVKKNGITIVTAWRRISIVLCKKQVGISMKVYSSQISNQRTLIYSGHHI